MRSAVRATVIAGCAALSFLAALPAAAQTTLRFGTVFSPTTSTFLMLVDACRKIEAESGGAVAIDIRPSGGYGKPTELLKLVDNGDIEIAYTVQGYTPARFPASAVLELPLIRETAVGGTRALWELYESGALARDYEGLKVAGLWALPAYGIFTAARPVAEPKDLRGLRIRSPSNTVGRALGKLGMVPVSLPLNNMGPGLRNNLIDGVAYGWYSSSTTTGVDGQPLSNQLKHMVDIGFSGPVVMLAMKKTVFDGLPAPVQALIDKHLGKPVSLAIAEERDQLERELKQKFAADGVHQVVRFTPAQLAEIRGELEEVYAEWVASGAAQGIQAQGLLDAARRAIAAHEKP